MAVLPLKHQEYEDSPAEVFESSCLTPNGHGLRSPAEDEVIVLCVLNPNVTSEKPNGEAPSRVWLCYKRER